MGTVFSPFEFRPPFAPAPPTVDEFPVRVGEAAPGVPGVFVHPEAYQMALPPTRKFHRARPSAMTEVASAVLARAARRRPGVSAALRFAFLAPSCLLSIAALAAVQQILLRTLHFKVEGWVMLAGWWALFPLALLTPVQLLAHRLFGRLDRPTAAEADRLGPSWERLRERAGIAPGRVRLLVRRKDEPAVHSSVGRVVVVAERDIAEAEPAELDALLAHQVGHQVRWHILPRITLLWARLPILLTWLVIALAGLVVKKMFLYCTQDHVSGMERLVAAAFSIVLAIGSAPLLVPALVGKFCDLISDLIDRRAEREADRVVCDLGAGMALTTHLEEIARRGEEERTGLESLLLLTPLIEKRARRIRAFLAAVTAPSGAAAHLAGEHGARLRRERHPW